MDERWQEIERIYHAARGLEDNSRAEYLTKACAGDASLRREVETLLAHGEQAGSFLEDLPATMVAKAFGNDEHSPDFARATLETGVMIAHYRLTGKLGEGGMGKVYRARDTKLQRDVALKILPQAVASDAERMARFEREAQVLASLNNPNIASIYGLEESNGVRALVMELAEGETLAEKIDRQRGALPYPDALPIARQIAEALEYAHERGIIHRDLKPANVKITPEGTVKVLDFGLAKVLGGTGVSPIHGQDAHATDRDSPTLTTLATQPGMILGTASYMSPEQAKGQPIDRRCDIWAFGCVLYEMLSGEKAFDGETISDILAAVLTKEPEWTALPETTPLSIQKLVRRCLQKDMRQRLQAIGDARIAIEETISAAGVTPGEAHGQDAQATGPLRRALPWALAVLLALAMITIVVLWKYTAPAHQASMHFSTVTNFAGVQAQPALSPDGRSVAFVSNRDGPYDIYVGLINGGNLIKLTDEPNYDARPCWSPDGTEILYARLNRSGIWDIWEVPALGGTPRRLILSATDPAWSRDGQTVAYQKSVTGELWISDLSGQNARLVAEPAAPGRRVTEPRFSPDGRELVAVDRIPGPYGTLEVIDLASGEVRQLTHEHALIHSPAWSPDGRSVYFASSQGGTTNIWKIAASGGEPRQITVGQGDDAELDVSPDGRRIIFSTFRERYSIARLDLQAKPNHQELKLLTVDPARSQYAPVYSPDGKHLSYFSVLKGAEPEGIWVADADGSNPVPLVQDKQTVNIFPHWTRDGNWVAYAAISDGLEYRRISILGGSPQRLAKPQVLVKDVPGTYLWFDIGPDGRVIYIGPKDQILTFDPRNDKTLAIGKLPAGEKCSLVRWSPDGHSIAFMVSPSRNNDPQAGIWVSDFKNPPRQIFRGWVVSYARGPSKELYVFEGRPDLNGIFWKVGWDGKGLTRITKVVPFTQAYWDEPVQNPAYFFDVSPDGRYIALGANSVLQANIGMIEDLL